jgi:hypothetical protein
MKDGVRERKFEDAYEFMQDLKERLAVRVPLTTDGRQVYVAAVGLTLRNNIDWRSSRRNTAHPGRTRSATARRSASEQSRASSRAIPTAREIAELAG